MKAAIIGTGTIAREHLGALAELPGVTTVGVCDLSETLAEATAHRFGVERWYTDYRQMLERARPDVVHVTTPPPSHHRLAMDCLDAGAHVLCEKPITERRDQFVQLRGLAEERGLMLVENHNYMFNAPMQRIIGMVERGELGTITSVEVQGQLEILGPGSRFADPNAPHPCLGMRGGAIADFLTHIAYLIYIFVGPHRQVRSVWLKLRDDHPLPSDEFRALVKCERGIGVAGFSAVAAPDGFWIKVQGSRGSAEANLWEPPRLSTKRRREGYGPLMTLVDGVAEAWEVGSTTVGGLVEKLAGGPLTYDGLYELVARLYRAAEGGGPPPVPMEQIDDVSRLVADFTEEENVL